MPTLKSKLMLSFSDVEAIALAAREEAVRNGWKVSIAIVDDGGHPLSLQRMDGAAPVSAYIAGEKAHAAALGRRDTEGFESMINGGRTAFVSVGPMRSLLGGGVQIVVDGQVVGAVGVSGVKPDQDAQVASAGAAAVQG